MHNKRLTDRLIGYWTLIGKGKAMPEITHLNPDAIADLWPHCLRIRVERVRDRAPTYHYDYMGERIVDAYGADLTGMALQSKMRHFPGAAVLRAMDDALENPRPISDEGQFINEKNSAVKYRACLLPFGNENKGVTHMVAGLSFREF